MTTPETSTEAMRAALDDLALELRILRDCSYADVPHRVTRCQLWLQNVIAISQPSQAEQRREAAGTVQLSRIKVTEEMHQAAVKVLLRANGVDGLPQRMVDAMLACSPQPSAVRPGEVLTIEECAKATTAYMHVWSDDMLGIARAIEQAILSKLAEKPGTTFMGFKVVMDETLSPGTMEFRHPTTPPPDAALLEAAEKALPVIRAVARVISDLPSTNRLGTKTREAWDGLNEVGDALSAAIEAQKGKV
jgi:hypothetical protein